MTPAKMQTARELIQERNYSTAKKVLETVDIKRFPQAQQWLNEINKRQPEVKPSTEAEKYYTRKNKQAKRNFKSSGFEMIVMGIILTGVILFFAQPTEFDPNWKIDGISIAGIALGGVCVLWGIRRLTAK